MRVLQINAVYGHKSTGTIVKDIEQCCERSGIECYVASPDTKVREALHGYVIGNKIDHKLHAFLCRISGKQAYYSHFPTLNLCHFIDQIKPDVVVLHNLHGNYIHLNILLHHLAHSKIQVVITLHDCWWFTGGCFHYTAVGCKKWMTRCSNCPKRFTDTPAYLLDASSKVFNDRKKYLLALDKLTIVGVSKWISEEAKKSFLEGKRIVTIYNGIDFRVFKPTGSNLRRVLGLEGKFVILGPSSKWLSPINRIVLDYFVENLTDDMVLLLFGAGKKAQSFLPKKVVLYGFTKNRRELAQLYSMADIFVNCSREDSLSFINIESQACGTPVISFPVTGISETVDLNSGALTTGYDEKELFTLVYDYYQKRRRISPELGSGFGSNYVDSYIRLFKELCSNKNM